MRGLAALPLLRDLLLDVRERLQVMLGVLAHLRELRVLLLSRRAHLLRGPLKRCGQLCKRPLIRVVLWGRVLRRDLGLLVELLLLRRERCWGRCGAGPTPSVC